MNHIADLANQFGGLVKKSFEQGTELTTRLHEEGTRLAHDHMGNLRNFMDFGTQAQTTLFNEWMKQTETMTTNMREMWNESSSTVSKAFETTATKTKVAKAS